MEERYFVIRCDENRSYGNGWFTLMAYPNSLEGAKRFCNEFATKEPHCKFLIAKTIIVAEQQIQVNLKEV